MKFTIDPRVLTIFGTWTSILVGICAIGPSFFEGAIPAVWIPFVLKWCAIFAFVNNLVLTGGTGFSSPKAGPWVSQSPVSVSAETIAKILIAAVALSFLLAIPSAQASPKRAQTICDPLNLIPGCKPGAAAAQAPAEASATTPTSSSAPASLPDAIGNLINQIQALKAEIIPNLVTALKEADADAGTVVVPASADGSTPAQVKDPVSHACYPALIQFLNSLPAPSNVTVPAPYDAIVLFQYKRDFINSLLSGQLIPAYLKVGCAALLGNEIQIFGAALGAVGIGVAVTGPIGAFATSALGAAAVSFPALLAIPK